MDVIFNNRYNNELIRAIINKQNDLYFVFGDVCKVLNITQEDVTSFLIDIETDVNIIDDTIVTMIKDTDVLKLISMLDNVPDDFEKWFKRAIENTWDTHFRELKEDAILLITENIVLQMKECLLGAIENGKITIPMQFDEFATTPEFDKQLVDSVQLATHKVMTAIESIASEYDINKKYYGENYKEGMDLL